MASIRSINATLWNSAKLLTDTITDNIGSERGFWRVVGGGTQATAYGVGTQLLGKEAIESSKDMVKAIREGHPGDAVMYGLYDLCLVGGAAVMGTLTVAALRSGFKNDNADALVSKVG